MENKCPDCGGEMVAGFTSQGWCKAECDIKRSYRSQAKPPQFTLREVASRYLPDSSPSRDVSRLEPGAYTFVVQTTVFFTSMKGNPCLRLGLVDPTGERFHHFLTPLNVRGFVPSPGDCIEMQTEKISRGFTKATIKKC